MQTLFCSVPIWTFLILSELYPTFPGLSSKISSLLRSDKTGRRLSSVCPGSTALHCSQDDAKQAYASWFTEAHARGKTEQMLNTQRSDFWQSLHVILIQKGKKYLKQKSYYTIKKTLSKSGLPVKARLTLLFYGLCILVNHWSQYCFIQVYWADRIY